MLEPVTERRALLSPQLALRVAILGGIAFVLFAVVFFRLWFLQVLSGEQYLAQANDNRVRDVVVAAPRGAVIDRDGRVLVDNRIGVAVQVVPAELPEEGPERNALYRSLGRVILMSPRRIAHEVADQTAELPFANVTLRRDVPRAVYSFVAERQHQFPGVAIQRVFLRFYPHRELAAQLFGTVGEINAEQLDQPRFRGVEQGTIVGQGGLEYTYDRYLRGTPGASRIQVDALGRPKGELALREPIQGRDLRLSVDVDLQRAGQQAMSEIGGVPIADGERNRGAAFVALDPRNGEVLALGSFPSFDPNVFARPLSQRAYERLSGEDAGSPLLDRAISAGYPTGSTFKGITATAAMESGVVSPSEIINDPGSIVIGDREFENAFRTAHGPIAMSTAIKVSSDVFFYTLGVRMEDLRGNPLQQWAARLGLGRETGIDLPGEIGGLIPSSAWRNELFREGLTDRPWSVGDNVNLSVGQGDLQATPLQMAVAYSTIVNGEEVVTPHIGLSIHDSAGRLLQEIDPPGSRRVALDEEYRQTILDGLRRAAGEGGGTSAQVFGGFPREVMGKTGTAERPGQGDQSWYIAAVDDPQRPIVLAVTVEQGGFGADTAAPIARELLEAWFGVTAEPSPDTVEATD